MATTVSDPVTLPGTVSGSWIATAVSRRVHVATQDFGHNACPAMESLLLAALERGNEHRHSACSLACELQAFVC
jgi:hypothetical protein